MPTRNRIRSTHALVLRRRDINDADRVLTVLTPRDGKLELIAKGVRKTNSRKAGANNDENRCGDTALEVARGV